MTEKCNEYITRRQAFEAVAEHNTDDGMTVECYGAVMAALGKIKPADVSPVRHAHWIENEDYSLTCSACGHTTDETVREARGDGVYEVLDPYFCPKCGARMDEEAAK